MREAQVEKQIPERKKNILKKNRCLCFCSIPLQIRCEYPEAWQTKSVFLLKNYTGDRSTSLESIIFLYLCNLKRYNLKIKWFYAAKYSPYSYSCYLSWVAMIKNQTVLPMETLT